MTEAGAVEEIEAFLREALAGLEPEGPAPGRGRPRVLPNLVLWGAVLAGVARGATSQREVWRLISHLGLWDYPRYPLSDQAVYARLADGGTAPLERVFERASGALAARLAPLADAALAPFATAVVALDETTLDPVARSLPSLRGAPPAARLPGKAAGVYDVRQQQWRALRLVADARQNEKVLARELAATLPRGSLILADLGYFGFKWFDDLTDAGQWWLSRLRAGTSYTVAHVLYEDADTLDALAWLGAHRADRARHLVRLVRVRHGARWHAYLTNVTDPLAFPPAEVARAYARRWDIELAVRLVKRELGAHLWWSAKRVVVYQQLWAILTVAQILQGLRAEVAARAEVDAFDVSLPLLIRYLPRFAAQGRDPLAAFLEHGRAAGFIRPARRVPVAAPAITPAAVALPPPDLPRVRAPRYAGRRCA